MRNKNGTGKMTLVDVTLVHTTCPSYIRPTFSHLKDILSKEEKLFERGLSLPPSSLSTPAVSKRVSDKNRKYALLVKLLSLQASLYSSASPPVFVAGVLSHV